MLSNNNNPRLDILQHQPEAYNLRIPMFDKLDFTAGQSALLDIAFVHTLLADQQYKTPDAVDRAKLAVLTHYNFYDPTNIAFVAHQITSRWTTAYLTHSPIRTLLEGLKGSEVNVTTERHGIDFTQRAELLDQGRVANATFNLFARDSAFSGLLATNKDMRDWLANEAQLIICELQKAGLISAEKPTRIDEKRILTCIILITTAFNNSISSLIEESYNSYLRIPKDPKDGTIGAHSWCPAIENCYRGLVGNIMHKLLTSNLLQPEQVYQIGSLAKRLARQPIKVNQVQAECKRYLPLLIVYTGLAELTANTVLGVYSYSRQPTAEMLQNLNEKMAHWTVPNTGDTQTALPNGLLVLSLGVEGGTQVFVVADGVNETLSIGTSPTIGLVDNSNANPILTTNLYRTQPVQSFDSLSIWGSAVIQIDQNGHPILPFNAVPYTDCRALTDQDQAALKNCINLARAFLFQTWQFLAPAIGSIGTTESPILLYLSDCNESDQQRTVQVCLPDDLVSSITANTTKDASDQPLPTNQEPAPNENGRNSAFPIYLTFPQLGGYAIFRSVQSNRQENVETPPEVQAKIELTLSDRRIQAVLKKTSTILRILRQDFGVKLYLTKGKGSHSRLERGGHHTTVSRALLKQRKQISIISTLRNKLLDLHIPERDFVLAALKYLRIKP